LDGFADFFNVSAHALNGIATGKNNQRTHYNQRDEWSVHIARL
jgi:hypothetical protein